MKEIIDFLKCPHYKGQPCPGENRGEVGGASGGEVVYVKNEKPISGDMLDFIREHHCGKCPKNAR